MNLNIVNIFEFYIIFYCNGKGVACKVGKIGRGLIKSAYPTRCKTCILGINLRKLHIFIMPYHAVTSVIFCKNIHNGIVLYKGDILPLFCGFK